MGIDRDLSSPARHASGTRSTRRRVGAAIVVTLAVTALGGAQTRGVEPQGARTVAEHRRLERLLPEQTKARAAAALAQLRGELITAPPETDLAELARRAVGAAWRPPRSADVDVLGAYLLMEAADDAEADIAAMGAELDRAGREKQAQMETIGALRARKKAATGASRSSRRVVRSPRPTPAAHVELPLLAGAGAQVTPPEQLRVPVGAGFRQVAVLATPRFGVLYPAALGATAVPSGPLSEVELDEAFEEAQGTLDRMNEMSEMTSLRLQMTMDRRSKLISTLSNLLKKVSQTQDAIVQNIR